MFATSSAEERSQCGSTLNQLYFKRPGADGVSAAKNESNCTEVYEKNEPISYLTYYIVTVEFLIYLYI